MAQLREVAGPDAPIGAVREYQLNLNGLAGRDGCLAFYTVHQCVEVYIGGELVAQWKSLSDFFIQTVGSNWTFVPLCWENGGKEILAQLMPCMRPCGRSLSGWTLSWQCMPSGFGWICPS